MYVVEIIISRMCRILFDMVGKGQILNITYTEFKKRINDNE